MRALLLLLSFCLVFIPKTFANDDAPYVLGDVLVRLPDGKGIESVVKNLQFVNGKATRLQAVRHISRHLNIWKLQFDYNAVGHQEMLEALWGDSGVRTAQNNHILSNRNTVPNDPMYAQQWQYNNTGTGGGTLDADIDAPEAWDITTGGNTALGDTIVVCVVDNEFDVTHADLVANRWFNYAEIPNNNLDDDGNGYIDDYLGWNIDSDDDDITGGGSHGSSVAGIIGARGDNGIGVAGVNWFVKVMCIVGGGNEAQAIESYDYALTQRKRYNQSGGTAGAFVVATNSSWGVDNLQWTNAPLWCSFYDSLGVAGILSAGATTNNEANVDVVGDMPTSCPSEYLLSVTNLNNTGNKNTPAGYGLTTVDLGAFGEGTYTTEKVNSYGAFGGTSGATPHVSGTIGLLYSVPCLRLAMLAKADPAAAALAVRDFILNSVVPNPDLQNISVTAGTLNLKNAVDEVLNWGCAVSGCHAPFGITTTNITGNGAGLRWWGVAVCSTYVMRYREEGTTVWTTTSTVDTFATLSGLVACTNYEFEVSADCDTAQSNYSTTFHFKTGDCCYAPTVITTVNVANTTADFAWNSAANVNNYTVEYKTPIASFWTTVTAPGASLSLTGLTPCTDYELRIISTCAVNVNNEYSSVITFRTKGCGACEDLTYCTSAGGDASYEWISNVAIGALDNTSASDDGYGDYTGNNAPELLVGQNHYLSLTVSRSSPSTVNFRVWMDFDQSGTFDATEKVLEIPNFSGTTTGDSVFIPATAGLGITRMRVSMRYNSVATECAAFNYGEVEDYCVNIGDLMSITTNPQAPTLRSSVYPNPFNNHLSVQFQSPQNEDAVLRLTNVAGQVLQTRSVGIAAGVSVLELNTAELPEGVYFLHIQTAAGVMCVHKVVK